MNLLIHDLTEDNWKKTAFPIKENTTVIDRSGKIRKCVGCFGCWVKTPGQCVIKDEYQKMGELLAQTEELTIISKCTFGSYSSFIKNVMDRSISYILPFFEIRKGEMHHKARYKNHIRLKVVFYGADVTQEEKETARKLVEANAVNFDAIVEEISFVENLEEMKRD